MKQTKSLRQEPPLFRASGNLYSEDTLGVKQGQMGKVHVSSSCIQSQKQDHMDLGSTEQVTLRNIILVIIGKVKLV